MIFQCSSLPPSASADARSLDDAIASKGRVEAGMLTHPGNTYRVIWAMYGSENIDASNQISTYLAIDALCQHPDYASRKMSDGKPLTHQLVLWEQWAYGWLKASGSVWIHSGNPL